MMVDLSLDEAQFLLNLVRSEVDMADLYDEPAAGLVRKLVEAA